MQEGLEGRKVAVLASHGVSHAELQGVKSVLEQSGATFCLISNDRDGVRAEGGPGDVLPAFGSTTDAHATEFEALVIPGGPHAERLSRDAGAVRIVREFMEADKPVAATSQGVLLLVAADVLRGRTITSPPELQAKIREAGGEWVDKKVHADQKLITGRGTDDIQPFVTKVASSFATAVREGKLDEVVEQSFPASDPAPGPVSIGSATASEQRV